MKNIIDREIDEMSAQLVISEVQLILQYLKGGIEFSPFGNLFICPFHY
jgi:hypothetical protein